MLQNALTFADRVKGTSNSNLERPTCLNFRTKANLKRHEVIQLLKETNFEPQELVDAAEMKSTSIDITCKTRQDTLQLYEKLRQIDFAYNIRLYESDNINVHLGWEPIFLSNEKIKRTIEEIFGKVMKITEKKYKDGLLSEIRILSMNKNDLKANPLPSYIHVDGFELYVAYPGQELTCKYCGEKGHFQAKCDKRLNDFPQLEKHSNDYVISKQTAFRQD